VLVVSVTVLGRSLFSVLRVNPGFEARGVLALQVALPSASYNPDRVVRFYSALQSAVGQRLGPRAVSYIDEIPLTGDRGRTVVSLHPTDEGREAVLRAVATGYFDVMRVPVVAGRGFEPRDNASAPPRAVVSESVAQRLFGAEQSLGHQVWLTATRQMAEIVGVVGEVKHRALDETTTPTVYLSALQAPSHGSIVVVRSALPDADSIAAVREEVGRLDRNLPVYGTRAMLAVVASSPGVPARRVLTATFLGFALLGVVLSATGLFGVVAHDVACRRKELALRIALGADASRLLRATLGQGARMVGSGLLAGGLLSFWAASALGNVLVTADHWDALSIGGAALVLIIVAAGAVLPAAVRAARTDPLVALRSE
jgi:putative ABC transport system permease protein